MRNNLIIDCFAGGGGASVGIELATGRQVDIAVNHDPDAILMHRTNHEKTLHLTEDIFEVDLKKYVKGRHVALMWASPDCFPAGNFVWTDKGYKKIEDIKCLDKVLTHTGDYQIVTRTIKKNSREFINIKIAGCETFQATTNHPFLARKKKVKCVHGKHRTTKTIMEEPTWLPAEELTSEYRVAIPINTNEIVPKWEGCVYLTSNTYGPTITELVNQLSVYMDNENFWWIVGRYFGDGHISKEKSTVDICCAFKEVEEVRSVLNKLDLKYKERDKKSTHSFLFYNKELCEFLSQFGLGSLEKNITLDILNLPKNLLKSFMDGYISADGHWDYSLTNPRCSMQTVSKKLAYGLQQCLLKAYGRYASLVVDNNPNNIIEGRTVNAHAAYVLNFYRDKTNRLQYEIENNIAWVNVKKAEKVVDKQKSIYTLTVENDESFTINNIAVHNCTSHSKAKGGKPREKGLRILPWAVYKHAKAIKPAVIIMENVEEIQQWGPLDKEGQPVKEKRGETYRAFIAAMKSIGYAFESRELVAADYGAPTTRKRWYAIFRRDGNPIVWPEPTHSRTGEDGLEKWVPAHTCLDFTDLGTSIFGRKKPLAEKTLKRIARGLRKFVFENDNPFVFGAVEEKIHGFGTGKPVISPFIDKAYGGNFAGCGSSVREPLHTITCVDHNRLITPYLIQYHSEKNDKEVRGQEVTTPLQTIDTSNRYGMVSAFLSKFYNCGTGQSMNEPLHTITTSPGHFGQVSILTVKKEELTGVDRDVIERCSCVSQFIMEYYGTGIGQSMNDPLHTIVTKERFALISVLGNGYVIADIFLRMLSAEELKLCQGFPKDYIISHDYAGQRYSTAKQVARIGNSVVPIMAQKLVEANCAELKEGERTPKQRINDCFTKNGEQLRFA